MWTVEGRDGREKGKNVLAVMERKRRLMGEMNCWMSVETCSEVGLSEVVTSALYHMTRPKNEDGAWGLWGLKEAEYMSVHVAIAPAENTATLTPFLATIATKRDEHGVLMHLMLQ